MSAGVLAVMDRALAIVEQNNPGGPNKTAADLREARATVAECFAAMEAAQDVLRSLIQKHGLRPHLGNFELGALLPVEKQTERIAKAMRARNRIETALSRANGGQST